MFGVIGQSIVINWEFGGKAKDTDCARGFEVEWTGSNAAAWDGGVV